MNPYRYDIQTLERKARAVRRHIVRLNANSPAGGHTGADLSQSRTADRPLLSHP
ncbi:hypothetical protein MJ390_08780 [Klebsiella pneumoniae]|nr:hypothetical protein MJ390_08780 [Klebsiella pneumoniae]